MFSKLAFKELSLAHLNGKIVILIVATLQRLVLHSRQKNVGESELSHRSCIVWHRSVLLLLLTCGSTCLDAYRLDNNMEEQGQEIQMATLRLLFHLVETRNENGEVSRGVLEWVIKKGAWCLGCSLGDWQRPQISTAPLPKHSLTAQKKMAASVRYTDPK